MKKSNKIFSVILAIIMVLSALPVSASAQDVTLTITSDKSDVKAGDTVTVNVILSENSNLNSLTIDLSYDNSILKVDTASSPIVLGSNAAKMVNKSYSENSVRVVLASAEKITAKGTVLSVSFTVLSSSCNTLSIDVAESLDGDFNEIPVTTAPLKIHSYGDWTTETNPTCENAGQKSKSCTCGAKITESIDALGHDYATEFTVDKVATCTEKGSKSQHCSRCDSKQNITEIPATGHSYKEEITKVPTHTENGEKTFTCSNCSYSYTETIEADGTHKHISAVTKEPTCTEKGVMTYTCACGDTYTEEIPMVAHKETTLSAVAPTCTQTGLTEGAKCSVCGEILTVQTVIPAKGHTETTLSAVAPTCTKTGLTEGKKCSVCGETLTVQTVIPAKGHTETTLSAVAPTCTQTGLTEGAKCSVCNAILTAQQEIPATGHSVNKDGYCDACNEKLCDHNCHKSGISGFFWKISNFFNKLFGTKKYCECGYAHY